MQPTDTFAEPKLRSFSSAKVSAKTKTKNDVTECSSVWLGVSVSEC